MKNFGLLKLVASKLKGFFNKKRANWILGNFLIILMKKEQPSIYMNVLD
jgi:hypothetical protein